MKLVRLIAPLALVLVLAGCSGGPGSAEPATTPPAPATASAGPVRALDVSIPSLGVRSSLVVTGKQPNGEVAVPDVGQPGQASFYGNASMPGAPGPALIMGHRNGGGQPGVFIDLEKIGNGELILIGRSDGSVAKFKVYAKEQVNKSEFPWLRVLAPTSGPELRLVTCGGRLDAAVHSYDDNIVVWASQA